MRQKRNKDPVALPPAGMLVFSTQRCDKPNPTRRPQMPPYPQQTPHQRSGPEASVPIPNQITNPTSPPNPRCPLPPHLDLGLSNQPTTRPTTRPANRYPQNPLAPHLALQICHVRRLPVRQRLPEVVVGAEHRLARRAHAARGHGPAARAVPARRGDGSCEACPAAGRAAVGAGRAKCLRREWFKVRSLVGYRHRRPQRRGPRAKTPRPRRRPAPT